MAKNYTLAQYLETIICENLYGTPQNELINTNQADLRAGGYNPTEEPVIKLQAREIADDLVRQALASGLQLSTREIKHKKLSGGNTAEFVGEISLNLPFVFKIDSESRKLALEGGAIQTIKGNDKLPQKYRDAWPHVYALRTIPPYAYLMEFFRREDGWLSLENILYSNDKQVELNHHYVVRLINSVLDILFDGYTASVNMRLMPNINEDYIGRIVERLGAAAAKDGRFEPKAIVVNGKKLKPWTDYIKIIESNGQKIGSLNPKFTTVVHGDPNPGNILLKVEISEVSMKLIDPKDWVTGDYLFDITKITHFIDGTGAIEYSLEADNCAFEKGETHNLLTYNIKHRIWASPFIEACKNRVSQFAEKHADRNWEIRYQLGMAANLLGLPANRIDKQRSTYALMLFGEGLIWLDKFCSSLELMPSE